MVRPEYSQDTLGTYHDVSSVQHHLHVPQDVPAVVVEGDQGVPAVGG